MTEEFIHYLWKYKLLKGDLTLVTGENFQVINTGINNKDAGPDFLNAKVRINNVTWAGNIEIHVNSSDWYAHNHQNDKSYDNIILHVVYNNNSTVKRENGEIIPTLEIKDKFDSSLFENYQNIIASKNWIPCEKQFNKIEPAYFNMWLERIVIERIERKVEDLRQKFYFNKLDWEQTFYESIARGFGFKLNSEPFEMLAKSIPLSCLAKHINDETQINALIFGQAGLLNDKYTDSYPQNLYSEYTFLRKKYNLKPLQSNLWRFLRIRPNNFPTVRLSQFAQLIFKSRKLFSKIIEAEDYDTLNQLFKVKASSYFDNHFLFDEKVAVSKEKQLGKSAIDLLVINVVVPFLFLYSIEKDDPLYKNRALKIIENIKPESNSTIKKWASLGFKAENSMQSQALLELTEKYCFNKRCLDCVVGVKILNNE
jgi:hypothetical protein